MSKLDLAIKFATDLHEGQVDLGGHSYILHPLRVMCAVEKMIRNKQHIVDNESILCSAVLHDCIEDSKHKSVTKEQINDIFGELIYKQVASLTREDNESWNKYIKRLNRYMAPRLIKIADLEDNLDDTRLKEITIKDINRNSMYKTALIVLRRYK